MSATSTVTKDESAVITLRILEELIGKSAQTIHVRLWDGSYWPDDRPHPATLVLKHPGALRAMLSAGTEVALAEAYLFDDFDVEGDIEAIFALGDELLARLGTGKKLRLAADLLRLPSSARQRTSRRGRARLNGEKHSIERDRQAIAYHYNVSNDFYSLFLDKRMVYSCAYFKTPQDDLDTAQEQKLEHICRKLRLQPGQRLLDVGCGWGGLVIYAAQKYGVDATGITLSEPQAELANRRIAEAGLTDHCRVLLMDYRELDENMPFDALVSVGMFEHVGAELLMTYFAKAFRLLKPNGVFLNHGIAMRATDKPAGPTSFTLNYVFPDGELVPINVTLRAAELNGFEVRDVESLREHYALTLRQWVRRLEANHEQALRYVDEPTYRVWRLFMSGSAYGFSDGRNTIYQTLLLKPNKAPSGLPLTRADWYRD
jgi:cyclopropane-fatty-acyl-phospholipid synthase